MSAVRQTVFARDRVSRGIPDTSAKGLRCPALRGRRTPSVRRRFPMPASQPSLRKIHGPPPAQSSGALVRDVRGVAQDGHVGCSRALKLREPSVSVLLEAFGDALFLSVILLAVGFAMGFFVGRRPTAGGSSRTTPLRLTQTRGEVGNTSPHPHMDALRRRRSVPRGVNQYGEIE